MQIILVHRRLAQARTLTLTTRHLVLAILVLAAMVLAGSAILNLVSVRAPALFQVPVVREVLEATTQHVPPKTDATSSADLNAMALKLAEMQAQLMRLEALGERVGGLAGVNPQEFNFREPPPRGGAEPSVSRSLSTAELHSALDQLSTDIEHRADYLDVIESRLMDSKLKSKMMPTSLPVAVTYNASGFGWRIDPFTGGMAMHEGIDFVAPVGTPIAAAAGGVVIASEWHHDFGNMIEIDHGNDITTLYAHTSRVFVHVGDIVRRNQHIADVGATGRATGSHLHFEVHVKGVPQNPAKFLESGGAHQDAIVAARAPVELPAAAKAKYPY